MNVFAPGQAALPPAFEPGDFILTHGSAFYSKLIRLGQRLRYGQSPFTHYNHAALIVSTDGELVEALGQGVVRSHLSDYTPEEYSIISIRDYVADAGDRFRVVRFAESSVGMRYDWLDILSIAVSLLTGTRLSIQTENHMICSGLVARALERTTAIFPRSTQHMMPADLAKFFNIAV